MSHTHHRSSHASTQRICIVEGCNNDTGRRSTYCGKHYFRLYRRGSINDPASVKPVQGSQGYWTIREPDHPLAMRNGDVYIHRKVVYDAAIPLVCHVCGKQHTWETVHIDHLDDDPSNNDLSNLAPACPRCNKIRGWPKALVTKRTTGRMLTHDGVTQCITDWARQLGIAATSINWRLANGWSVERALTTHRGKTGPRPSQSPQG